MEIIGHEKRWAALALAFGKGTVPQTLLISGAAQVGKWTLARRYAQLLLCPHPELRATASGETLPAPCGHCRVCHQVEIETFPDFKVFRPIVSSSSDERDWVAAPETLVGSVISVHMARKFGNESLTKPFSGQRKVMLINQADRMTVEAQNALLKTFEEPVPSLSIILLTDNPSQLLPTVISRCWHLPLGLVSDRLIADWLPGTCTDAATLEPEWIAEAVRVGAGRPGAARRELRRLQRRTADTAGAAAKGKKGGADGADAGAGISRFAQATEMVARIARSQPVGALGLTEEALRLAKLWWAEDQEDAARESKDAKKSDAKMLRSAVARCLDELANAYRTTWIEEVERSAGTVPGTPSRARRYVPDWADGLDQIRKTRHYILHNANTNLALDVLFGRLIALNRGPAQTQLQVPPGASVRPSQAGAGVQRSKH